MNVHHLTVKKQSSINGLSRSFDPTASKRALNQDTLPHVRGQSNRDAFPKSITDTHCGGDDTTWRIGNLKLPMALTVAPPT
jgi:hypothetical protein